MNRPQPDCRSRSDQSFCVLLIRELRQQHSLVPLHPPQEHIIDVISRNRREPGSLRLSVVGYELIPG